MFKNFNQSASAFMMKRFGLFVCALILLMLWLLFFWRFLTPNVAHQLRFAQGDFTLHYFAFADYQVEQIQAGNMFPLWNPYNYAGDPFMGNIQWATWYPLRFLTALLAANDGLSIEIYQFEIILHYLIASFGMFAFLRQLVRRNESALIGAIIYTYGGYLTGYPMLQPSVLAAVTWTPFVMLGIHTASQTPLQTTTWRYLGIALASVGITLSLLGGHPQTSMYMLYLAGAYWLYRSWRGRKSALLTIFEGILIFGLGAGMAMMQLLPSIEFTMLSARVQDLFFEAKSNGLDTNEIFQIFYPLVISQWSPLYLGFVGLMAVLGAIIHFQQAYRFWLIVIVIGILLSFGGNSIIFDVFYLIVPGFSTFRQQERVISIVVFALVILATYRIDQWLFVRSGDLTGKYERMVVFIIPFITGGIAFAVSLLDILAPSLLINLPIRRADNAASTIAQEVMSMVFIISVLYTIWFLWQSTQARERWLVAVLLGGIVVFDLFTFNTRYSINFVPFEPRYVTQAPDYLDLLQHDVEAIQWRVDGGASLQGHGTYWRIPDMYGTGPFELSSTERLLHIGVDKRWELFSVRYVSQPEGSVPPEYVLTDNIGEGMNYFGQTYVLYELLDPRPMAHLVYDVHYPSSTSDDIDEMRQIIREIVNGPINLRQSAVVANTLPITLSGERPENVETPSFRYITPESIEIVASTPEKALLSVSIPNYPAWQATVNERPVEIIELYGGLIGIPLDEGDNQQIQLTFVSRAYHWGAAIAILSLFSTLGLIALGFIRARYAPQEHHQDKVE